MHEGWEKEKFHSGGQSYQTHSGGIETTRMPMSYGRSNGRMESVTRFRGRVGAKEIERKRKDFEDLFTVFVDGIPKVIDTKRLRAWFNQFGSVMDTFIPSKRRRNTQTRFGFVRFKNKCEAENAIRGVNGVWRHGHKLNVRMAVYGRITRSYIEKSGIGCERKEEIIDTVCNKLDSELGIDSVVGDQRMSYRQALTGVNPGRNIGVDIRLSQSVMQAVEDCASRVAFLESEVTRLQQALISAMSNDLLKKESGKSSSIIERQQMEVVSGEEGRNVSSSGEGNHSSIVTEATEIASKLSNAKEVSVLSETAGSVREDAVIMTEKFDDGESAGSFTGDKGPAGSGEEGETGRRILRLERDRRRSALG